MLILSFFWRHIKPYKWYYFVMLIAPIIGALYSFFYHYAIKLLLDVIADPTMLSYKNFLYPVALFVITQIIMDMSWRISNIVEWKAEPYVRRSILLNSYDYVQHHSYSFFQDNFTGAISSKLKGLLDGYDKFWAEMHHGLSQKILKILISLGALFYINTYLGICLFVWSVVYMTVIYLLSLKFNQFIFAETEARHSLIGQISDKITNIMTLFAFASRKKELHHLDHQILTDFIPKQVASYKCYFKIQLVAGILYCLMFVFIVFYAVHLKMKGFISVGDFSFIFGLAFVLSEELWSATISFQEFARSMGDLRSALSILQIPQTGLDEKRAKVLKVKHNSIEFKNVWFGYDDSRKESDIFQGLNLKIKSGEKIGLVGSSGAGKSSLVNLLSRYFRIREGEILIDNQNIDSVTQDSLREHIAVIPQDTLLFHRSIMENIRYGQLEATDKEVIFAAKKAHIHEYIQTLPEGYNTHVGERGIKLSGGQRQRIAIARAILKDAPILVLDEATSALDSETEKLIQKSLNALIQDKRKTVIAIAHRLSTLKHMDRIVVLDRGEILEEGTHEMLIKKRGSLYKKLWEHQEI